MRLAFFALVLSVIVWSCPIGAQTRGASGSASASSSASSGGSVSTGATRSFSGTNSSVSGTSSTSTTTPGRRTFLGVPVGQEHRNSNRDFGRDFGNHHRRRPYGYYGYPYGYGYGDYSSWYTDQNQAQDQQNMAQSERLQQSYQDDQKRQRELERQLADQRAADAADAAERDVRYAPAATTRTAPDRDLPPTVLVYKDHHQVEIQNYAVTGSMIYEFNPHWTRKIPLSDLDIPATIAANNERGVEFKVPNSSAVKAKPQQQQQ